MPKERAQSTTNKLTMMGLFIAVMVIGSTVKISLPLVPLSIQSLFPLLAGVLFDRRTAVTTQLGYLLLGLLGVPVFSQGGGIGYVLRPTFGYLLALPVAAYWVSSLMHRVRGDPDFWGRLCILMSGSLLILLIGAVYFFVVSRLLLHAPLSFHQVFFYSFLIFLPGELIKSLAVSYLAMKIKKHVPGRRERWASM